MAEKNSPRKSAAGERVAGGGGGRKPGEKKSFLILRLFKFGFGLLHMPDWH